MIRDRRHNGRGQPLANAPGPHGQWPGHVRGRRAAGGKPCLLGPDCRAARRPICPRHRRPDAFTLVEITIVLLIVGIITAVAAPRLFDALSYHRAESAALRIRRDLQLARRIARTQSSQQSVQFVTVSNSYTLPGVADFDRSGRTYTVQLGDSTTMATLDTANFGGDAEVIFDGYGLPDTSGAVTIQVGNYQRTVTVEPDGFVVVQ